jgi:hypothetical protein
MRKPENKRMVANSWWRPMLTLGVAALVAFAGGWLLGMNTSGSRATAAPPAIGAAAPLPPLGPEPSPDYTRRVVARIYGNVDITREDLGEYLIARYGAEKADLLINKRIIEKECREKGIDVVPVEVEAAFDSDCRELGVDKKVFVDQMLHQYKKTLYEWKEDVLKPRLLMGKYCQDRVTVTEEDLHQAFERHYGEKVQVRILLYPPDQARNAEKTFAEVRNDDDAFAEAARHQPNPQLAAKGGEIQPITHFGGNDEHSIKIEKTAFSLKPGEVSEVLSGPEGVIIMKCIKRIPPDRTKVFETEREALKREVTDKKSQEEIGKAFVEMKKRADPVNYLKPALATMADLNRGYKEAMSDDNPREKPNMIVPAGGVSAPK